MKPITRIYNDIKDLLPFFILYITDDGEIIRVVHAESPPIDLIRGDNFWEQINPSTAVLLQKRLENGNSEPVQKIMEIGPRSSRSWFDCKLTRRLYRGRSIISVVGLEVDAIMRRVSEYQKQVTSLKQVAYKDPMTGIYNRRGFWEIVSKKRLYESSNKFSIIVLDIDNLRLLNEKGGHDYGDEQIKAVATAVRKSVRPTDSVARFGGDEMVILLTEAPSGELNSEVVAKRIIDNISNDSTIETTVTMGVVDSNWGEVETHSPEVAKKFVQGLITEADQKLMRGKSVAKNSYYK